MTPTSVILITGGALLVGVAGFLVWKVYKRRSEDTELTQAIDVTPDDTTALVQASSGSSSVVSQGLSSGSVVQPKKRPSSWKRESSWNADGSAKVLK